MERPYTLAQSPWPRSGAGRANQARAPFDGPTQGRIAAKLTLPFSGNPQGRGPRGAVVCEDGSLRVACGGSLAAVSAQGDLRWSLTLREPDGSLASYHSLPVALQGGATLLTLAESLLLVDERGVVLDAIPAPTLPHPSDPRRHAPLALDDSGPSPNLTHDGQVLVTAPGGDVARLGPRGWSALGVFGYDIVPPVVYDDDTLGVSGYAGRGYCRVDLHGLTRWRSNLQDADLTVALSDDQTAAVPSLNDGLTRFFASDGSVRAEFGAAAVCSSVGGGGWIAAAEQRLVRLTADAQVLWSLDAQGDATPWGVAQVPVDAQGRAYLGQDGALWGIDPHGGRLFTLKTPKGPIGALSLVAPRLAAWVVGRELLLIE
jgi:hypothetical protein